MSWNITDRFPSWGETGESPQDGFFYDGGDQVNEKHLDYLWNSVKGLENDVQSALNDIDNDSDGVVDKADSANTYKGNEIDSDGDGVVDDATNVTATYKGNDIDSDGDGTVDESDSALTYKGNDIDSDGDGTVNSADTAEKVKGNDIDSDGDGTVDESDSALTYKGNDIDSDGDGTVNSADTAEKVKGNDIDSDGDGKVNAAVTADDGVPSGGIVMWSGSTTNIPSGWTLCDGTDGAPDLRNRFVAGAGDEYNVGDTGGEKEHTLSKNEMPSHTHTETRASYDGGRDGGTGVENGGGTVYQNTQTSSAGGDQPHENRPRFYSLAYIYKL
jgi:hypothetical protein